MPSVSVLPFPEALHRYRSAWKALVADRRANPSLDPDWLAITAKSHGLFDTGRVLVFSSGETPAAFLAFVAQRKTHYGLPLREVVPIANFVAYHHELPTLLDPDDTLRALLASEELGGWDVFRFAAVPEDSPTDLALRRLADSHRVLWLESDASPYLTIDESEDFDAFLSTKRKKFRYKYRKRQETLTGESSLRLEHFDTADSAAALMAAVEQIERHSWKQSAGLSIADSEREKDYTDRLLPFLADAGALRANVLYNADVPVAYAICCHWGRWFGHLKTSFNAEHAGLSPGAIVIDDMIRIAFEAGASEFDFLGDADPHKTSWSNSIRRHRDYFVYSQSRIRSSIVGRFKSRRIASAEPVS